MQLGRHQAGHRASAIGVLQPAAADGVGITPAQVALQWLLQQAPNVLLIPGTGSIARLRETWPPKE
jgi:aryl-alcohol dehydrogenase-like predicted oxidoreductase